MYKEYFINTIDEKDIDIKNNIESLKEYHVTNILAPIAQAKLIKKTIENKNIGCLIDYPSASADISRRQDLINDAIKVGVNYISIPIPFYYIINRKYDKFRDDITKNLELCKSHQVDIRYILEYRKFDHMLLHKICEILMKCEVDLIYPSTGFFLDNIEDNIIACAYLKEKTGIRTIVNGNIWQKSQADSLVKFNPYGFSSNSIFSFSLLG